MENFEPNYTIEFLMKDRGRQRVVADASVGCTLKLRPRGLTKHPTLQKGTLKRKWQVNAILSETRNGFDGP